MLYVAVFLLQENLDKEIVMRVLSIFAPKPSFLIEEALINRRFSTNQPHGAIDLMLLSPRHTCVGFLLAGITSSCKF